MFEKLNKIKRALSKITPLKVLNLFLVMYQKLIQKGDTSLGKPMVLLFDPSNYCNLHCPLCPTGQGKKGRTKKIAEFAQYKKVVDDLKKYLFFIHLVNWGEPLLNPELVKMVEYANKNKIDTILYSNLTLLEANVAEELIKSGLNEIVISLDGATEKIYSKYRKGGNFFKVIQNLKILVELKKKYSSSIVLRWQFLVFSHNEHELALAKKMAQEIGVVFSPYSARVDMALETSLNRKEIIDQHRAWFPRIKKFHQYNLKSYLNRRKIANCNWLWTRIVVNPDGSVSPCCSIWEEKYDFGNAFKEGVLNVWNGRKYREARRAVRTKKPANGNICSNCLKNGFIS